MLTCLKNVVLNAQAHQKAGDPTRIYSQYIRYALNQFDKHEGIRLTSRKAKGKVRPAIVHDHSIPHSFVLNKLLALKNVTNEALKEVINKHYRIGIITKEEDELLTRSGLRKKMPDGWDEKSGSVYARYEKVGITLFSPYGKVGPL
jgi:hypothetical protein